MTNAQTTCPVCNSNNRKREQKLIDIMFEQIIRLQMKHKFSDREEVGAWVAKNLRDAGFETRPIGSSWGVLQ